MKKLLLINSAIYFLLFVFPAYSAERQLTFCGSTDNNLISLLKDEELRLKKSSSPEEAIANAPEKSGVIIVSDFYPEVSPGISLELYNQAKRKGLRLYVEYPASFPGINISGGIFHAILERGVITSELFVPLKQMEIVENILANFRISSKNGFYSQGGSLTQAQIQQSGWQTLGGREDLRHIQPHYESWMWACYLWLYDKTGYQPLLDKAKAAIRLTMEAYPGQWRWTNGIQQERARMILPLAWLVRVEDTQEHRKWLDVVVNRLLENQQECGAIEEELGAGEGAYGRTPSNKKYGVSEAPLIFDNGDPVADMLYTSNFAFFALNEAARATGNKKYTEAVRKISDFLTRIQVRSNNHPDLDGAWFRAFDYKRWDYWASNADHGWGAWSTLTGWIQSWIIAMQVLFEQNIS